MSINIIFRNNIFIYKKYIYNSFSNAMDNNTSNMWFMSKRKKEIKPIENLNKQEQEYVKEIGRKHGTFLKNI